MTRTSSIIQLKKLKVKPKKTTEPAPCLAEMAALLNCWSSLAIEHNKCSESAKNLSLCMMKPVVKTKKVDDTNHHLFRLGKLFK
ncbi:hypothetical protein K502DRAFT_351900 [Neoconidiobolus thromboides FSU 785]|nr:hypothetical protein K502DRAFT_351900 [Neoconidiobolus thromboides FSU 785]